MNVLIADDHALLRRGLRQILTQEMPGARFTEASNGEQVMAKLAERPVDILLLDISMPGKNGIELLREVRRKYPDCPVLVLSVHAERLYAVRALKAGASGYLTKDVAPDGLVEAIQKIRKGGRYVSAALAELLAADDASTDDRPLHEKLSNREDAIFRRLAAGQTVGQIAKTMALSVKTVSTYRTRVLDKLQMTTNAALMRYAIDQKLVE